MVFCKGTIALVKRVIEALLHFSNEYGLEENSEKSNMYMEGVIDAMHQDILRITGFTCGIFPMSRPSFVT